MPDDNILDESLREWIRIGVASPRRRRFTMYTTDEVVTWLSRVATERGWSASRVAHLAIMFGLTTLVKYWEENEGVKGNEL